MWHLQSRIWTSDEYGNANGEQSLYYIIYKSSKQNTLLRLKKTTKPEDTCGWDYSRFASILEAWVDTKHSFAFHRWLQEQAVKVVTKNSNGCFLCCFRLFWSETNSELKCTGKKKCKFSKLRNRFLLFVWAALDPIWFSIPPSAFFFLSLSFYFLLLFENDRTSSSCKYRPNTLINRFIDWIN